MTKKFGSLKIQIWSWWVRSRSTNSVTAPEWTDALLPMGNQSWQCSLFSVQSQCSYPNQQHEELPSVPVSGCHLARPRGSLRLSNHCNISIEHCSDVKFHWNQGSLILMLWPFMFWFTLFSFVTVAFSLLIIVSDDLKEDRMMQLSSSKSCFVLRKSGS